MQFVGIVGAVTILTGIITANIYDIKNTNRRHGAKQQARYRRRPIVSIVIHATTTNELLKSTLNSVRK